MSNMDSLLARAAAMAQREGYTPPAGSDVANHMAKVSSGASVIPSGDSVGVSPARPGYNADQSMSRALGLMGKVTRGFSGGLDPVSQLRALPGGQGSPRVAQPNTSGLTRFDGFMSRLNDETDRAMSSIDTIVNSIPSINRVMGGAMNTLRSGAGAQNAPKSKDRVNFAEIVGRRPAQFASDFPTAYGSGSTIPRPKEQGSSIVYGETPFAVSSPQGMRVLESIYGHDDQVFHQGVDYKAAEGTPIPSPVFGTVVNSGYDNSRGNYVVIRDPAGYEHWIMHLAQPTHLSSGDKVQNYDTVGLTGATGAATGPHVHYEVHVSDQYSGDYTQPSDTRWGNPVLYDDWHPSWEQTFIPLY